MFKRHLARSKYIGLEICDILINGDVNVKASLASNPIINAEMQFLLCKNSSSIVLYSLVENPSLNKKIHEELTQRGIWKLPRRITNFEVAKNICLDKSVQIMLAKVTSICTSCTRMILASNPSICSEVRLILSKDEQMEVRHWLKNNV